MSRLRCRLRKRLQRQTPGLSSSAAATAPAPNLFARLPLDTARRLYDQACRVSKSSDSHGTVENCWRLSSGGSALEFLPLCVEFKSGEVIYVSYNGGEILAVSEEESDPTIELPECLLPETTVQDEEVLVEALARVENGETVDIEPLAVRDWELLQEHAEQLEGGDLLQQISIVYPNQTFPLQVGSHIARVRVLETNFGTQETIWPSEAAWPPCDRRCLRLIADTEVIVCPLVAPTANDTGSPVLRVLPCMEDYSQAMQQFAENARVSTTIQRMPHPYTVAIHPNALASCETFGGSDAEPGLACLELLASKVETPPVEHPIVSAVARIVLCATIPEDCAVLHPLIRLQLGARPFLDQVALRVLNHVEAGRMARRFGDCAQKCTGRHGGALSLVPITAHLQSVQGSVWRDAAARKRHQWKRAPPATPSLPIHVPDEMGDLPIQVGGLLQLPFDGVSKKQLFRIELASEADEDPQDEGPMIFFARDLGMYIGSSSVETSLGAHWQGREVLSPPRVAQIKDYLPTGCVLHDEVLQLARRAAECSGALICGPRGSGRSHTALVLAAYAEFARAQRTVYLDCKKLRDSRKVGMKDILFELTQLFQDAIQSSSCSVVLDDLDELIPTYDSGGPQDDSAKSQQVNPAAVEQSKLIGDAFCALLDMARSRSRLLVIATCGTPESISESVVSSAMLGSPVMVPSWTSKQRENFLLQLVGQDGTEQARIGCDIGKLTEGYRPQDLVQVALRVCERERRTENIGESFDNIVTEELSAFVPLGRAAASVERSDTGPSWSEVGGLYRTKEHLASTIIKPSMYRRIYESSQARLPRGVLLYGPPGTGKSYVVSALAKECDFRLITCRGAELLDKYIGASEANVRELFARATAVAPSILFLDEIDALAPVRGSDHTGVTDRIVNQLLTFLDGVEDISGCEKVYIVAATSRPDKIDPALLRPGRLEKHVYVGFPETNDEVTDVLSKIAARYNITEEALIQIQSGEFIHRLVEKGCFNKTRMSPADIKGAFNTAQVIAVHEALDKGCTDSVVICSGHLEEALSTARPSLSIDEYSRLQFVYAPYRGDVSPSRSADPADAASGTHLPARLEREPLRTALR